MSKDISWGILSTANIGIEHVIPAIQDTPRCKVVAIASRGIDRARAVADQLGIEKAYGTYEELLADPSIDVIYNPLPNHLHVPWTIRAMEAGKHVLCEKPIALTAQEAKQLVKVRERTGKLVAEAFMVRFHPQWQRAREIVQSGLVGDVKAIQTFFSYFNTDPENVRNMASIGGGGLYDIGCYAIATARFIYGSEPERVIGSFEKDPTFGTDRLCGALAVFPEGRHLNFICSTQLVPYQRVQICGTLGRIEIEIPFNAPNRSICRLFVDDGSDLRGTGIRTEEFPICDQYSLQASAFARAALGEVPWPYPIEDAVCNMRVIDALLLSAESGTWEQPDERLAQSLKSANRN
jgi:predicted dehydrogenase